MLKFDCVSKQFRSIKAVDELSFEVNSGSVVGLLGPNGAGKSTAMRILLGLSAASSGKVSLLGHEPGSPGFAEAIKRTGSHIERPALYERATARQNLEIHGAAFGIGSKDQRITTTLETIGLSGRSGDKVKNFSLGMRQRMSLGVAILHDPELVVLDEPTNGLDPSGVIEIREVIRSLPARGMTCLVSSHVLGEIEKTVDDVVIIRDGRLVAEGPIGQIVGAGSGSLLVRLPQGSGAAGTDALAAAGLKATLDGDIMRVEAQGKPGSAIAEILANARIYPDELRAEGANLEDVFINLTSGESADER